MVISHKEQRRINNRHTFNTIMLGICLIAVGLVLVPFYTPYNETDMIKGTAILFHDLGIGVRGISCNISAEMCYVNTFDGRILKTGYYNGKAFLLPYETCDTVIQ